MDKKFDYQVVTSTNEWVGGGTNSSDKQIKQEVEVIKERLKEESFEGEIIVYKAEKMTQTTYKI